MRFYVHSCCVPTLLRHRYDRVTNVRRIRLDSARINTNKVRFSYDIQNNIGKYGTYQLRIHPKHLRIIYESCTNEWKYVAVLDNSWDFLSIIRYNLSFHLPLLVHNFQNKCSSESCCCIGSTFAVPIPTADSTKKTALKN